MGLGPVSDSMWPSTEVVSRGFKGQIAEMIVTPYGVFRGIRSVNPKVYFIFSPDPDKMPGFSFVHCEECKASEATPDPPTSAEPGAPRGPLVAPGTQAHALFILTWLHKFYKQHLHETQEEES